MNDYVIIDGVAYSADELYHHGIKGMKWGIRKDRKKRSNRKDRKKHGNNSQYDRLMSRANKMLPKTSKLLSKVPTPSYKLGLSWVSQNRNLLNMQMQQFNQQMSQTSNQWFEQTNLINQINMDMTMKSMMF